MSNLITVTQKDITTAQMYDNTSPPLSGYKRQWYKCRKCGSIQCRDFVPYSMSNPILTSRCGHDWSELKTFDQKVDPSDLLPFDLSDIDDVRLIVQVDNKHYSLIPKSDKDGAKVARMAALMAVLDYHSICDTALEDLPKNG